MKTKEQLRKLVTAKVKKELRWDEESQLKTREVAYSFTKEEAKERKAKQRAWKAMVDEGLKDGWLEWTNEYSGSHVVAANNNVAHDRTVEVVEDARSRQLRIERMNVELQRRVDPEVERLWAAQEELNKLG